MIGPIPAAWAPHLLSVLRIVASFGFMTHGTQKLFGVPTLEPRETAELFTRSWTAGMIETFAGTLLVVGLFTRPAAFLCSGLMAFAYFIAHAPDAFWPVLNGGELPVAYCFLFLYLAAAGGGPLSLDALLWNRAGRRAGS